MSVAGWVDDTLKRWIDIPRGLFNFIRIRIELVVSLAMKTGRIMQGGGADSSLPAAVVEDRLM